MLTTLAEKTGANDLALAYLGKTNEAVGDYKVNLAPEVKNTFFVYVNKKVTAKFVNLEPDEKGLADLKAAITAVTATP